MIKREREKEVNERWERINVSYKFSFTLQDVVSYFSVRFFFTTPWKLGKIYIYEGTILCPRHIQILNIGTPFLVISDNKGIPCLTFFF